MHHSCKIEIFNILSPTTISNASFRLMYNRIWQSRPNTLNSHSSTIDSLFNLCNFMSSFLKVQAIHKPKCLQNKPRSLNFTLQLCILESFPKKNDKISRSKTQKVNFVLENTTYIVWFKWNQSTKFFVQLADFTWLKWNQSIEK